MNKKIHTSNITKLTTATQNSVLFSKCTEFGLLRDIYWTRGSCPEVMVGNLSLAEMHQMS